MSSVQAGRHARAGRRGRQAYRALEACLPSRSHYCRRRVLHAKRGHAGGRQPVDAVAQAPPHPLRSPRAGGK